MKQNSNLTEIAGWILLVIAMGFFCLQMVYFYAAFRFQVEYVDDQLFYAINLFCLVCLGVAIFLLLALTRWKIIITSVVVGFLIVNAILLVGVNNERKQVTSLSPNLKNVLSIKADVNAGNAIYYRSHYGIFARPKEILPKETIEDVKVEWLANDIAAVTYTAADESIQQFIATYGDRGSGISYYYVGPEIQGQWVGDNIEVVSDTEGISVTQQGKTEFFDWEHQKQYGTLAIVLMKNNEAAWTISLNENFTMYSDASITPKGEITIYKATMKETKPILLERQNP